MSEVAVSPRLGKTATEPLVLEQLVDKRSGHRKAADHLTNGALTSRIGGYYALA